MNAPPIDEHEFISGLDLDSEEREIKNGSSRYVLNGRSGTSDTNKVGVIESIRGNQSYGTILPGETVIGSCADTRNNATIQFIHNNTVTNITYTSATPFPTFNSVVIVAPSIPLVVGSRYRITQGLNIVTGIFDSAIGDAYFFTILTGAMNGDPVTAIGVFGENLIRRWFAQTNTFEKITNPAFMGLVLGFELNRKIINPRIIESGFGQILVFTDGNKPIRMINIDYLKEGGLYYNIAKDEQYINLSKRPPQKTAIPIYVDGLSLINLISNKLFQFRYRFLYDSGEISAFGDISDVAYPLTSNTKNNQIDVSINTGHKTVKKIQVAYRFGNGDEIATWYIFNTYSKDEEGWPDNSTVVVSFTGAESLTQVSSVDTNKNFEAIPQKAGYTEVVNESAGNQIIAANITEGYDNYTPSSIIDFEYDLYQVVILSESSFLSDFTVRDLFSNPAFSGSPVQAGWLVRINIIVGGGPMSSRLYELTAPDVVSFAALANRISLFLNTEGVGNTLSFLGSDAYFTYTGADYMYTGYIFTNKITRGLKDGAKVDLGIVYQDSEYRNGGVNILQKDLDINSMFTNETGTTVNLYFRSPKLKVLLTTPAPSWARSYHFALTESTIRNSTTNMLVVVPGVGTILAYDNYSFTPGDRIRVRTPYNLVLGPGWVDLLIKTYDPISRIVQPIPSVPFAGFSNQVEIYTPNNQRFLFFESSINYDIVSGYHGTAKIFGGDSFYKTLFITDAVINTLKVQYPCNVMSFSDDYVSDFWFKGRVQIETPNQKTKNTGTLQRWGGAIVNNTQVNQLSVWDEGNYNNDINARFGDITGLRQVGYTLKILQWSNINSAFLGRRQIQNADGSTQLVITDSLIGTINPSEQEYGTKYPSSVVLANNNLFFFDAIKGVYCMDSGNGVITISDALAERFWLDTATLVKSDSRYEVISGFDFMYNDMYVTIKLVEEGLSTTIYFNVDDKRWKSFVEMFGSDDTPIDWYGAVGQTFVTFLKGQVWEQNCLTETGAPVYSKLFGVQRKFINEFVTNVDKSKVKVFLTHGMHVNTLPEIVKFQTPINDMYPSGMYSELLPANYKYKEGVYYAALKNDAYTKGIPVDDPAKRLQIATGRPLRGHCMNVRIEFVTPKYVVLMSSGVGQIISDKS